MPTTFNFLGFAHVWGKSRWGKDVVRQVTAKDRFARTVATIDGPASDQSQSNTRVFGEKKFPLDVAASSAEAGNRRRAAVHFYQGRRHMRTAIACGMTALFVFASTSTHAQSWMPPDESQRCPSKWGAGDERGSGNHMKPASVLKAARLIKTGEVIEIGHVLRAGMPL